jgi:hypothetical protein
MQYYTPLKFDFFYTLSEVSAFTDFKNDEETPQYKFKILSNLWQKRK